MNLTPLPSGPATVGRSSLPRSSYRGPLSSSSRSQPTMPYTTASADADRSSSTPSSSSGPSASPSTTPPPPPNDAETPTTEARATPAQRFADRAGAPKPEKEQARSRRAPPQAVEHPAAPSTPAPQPPKRRTQAPAAGLQTASRSSGQSPAVDPRGAHTTPTSRS